MGFEAFLAALHYLSIFATFSVVLGELLLYQPRLSAETARRIQRLDLLYLVAVIVVMTTGLLRALYFGKGPAFYFSNPIFITKLVIFGVIGACSLPPTIHFLRWNRELKSGAEDIRVDAKLYRKIRRWILVEQALLAFMPILAVLMARGVGL
jgi:putative membrane protein